MGSVGFTRRCLPTKTTSPSVTNTKVINLDEKEVWTAETVALSNTCCRALAHEAKHGEDERTVEELRGSNEEAWPSETIRGFLVIPS